MIKTILVVMWVMSGGVQRAGPSTSIEVVEFDNMRKCTAVAEQIRENMGKLAAYDWGPYTNPFRTENKLRGPVYVDCIEVE